MNLPLRKNRNGGTIGRLHDEMEQTFARFLNEPWGVIEPRLPLSEGWLPAVDVSETEGEISIRAEVPGIAAQDLDVTVMGGTLTISGAKEAQAEKKGENYYQCERRFGSFRRVIDLPDTADPDKVTAESDNGVLTIRIAKKPGARPKQIEIKPAGRRVAVTG